ARPRAAHVTRLTAEPGSGGVVAREHARSMEGVLAASFDAVRSVESPRSTRVALVATGGLGRRELGLFSDLDMVIVSDDPLDPVVRSLAERFFHLLWDLGLDVGHAVQAIPELVRLASADVRTATMLLDRRWIAGDRTLAGALDAAAAPALERLAAAAIARLAEEREGRHHRYLDSP
ncbi:MAG: DUF294 nucleotidyltransferase-like domain-containing protein, partial [Deltaproteobacteria bacterium]